MWDSGGGEDVLAHEGRHGQRDGNEQQVQHLVLSELADLVHQHVVQVDVLLEHAALAVLDATPAGRAGARLARVTGPFILHFGQSLLPLVSATGWRADLSSAPR